MIDKIKIAIFITVRTGSSRLPKKCLFNIKNKPIIVHLIEWAKRAEKIDDIILCTTEKEEDSILCQIAKENGISYYRGSENNVIKRQIDAAYKYNVDFVIDLEGDSIFYPSEYIDAMAEMARKSPEYDVIQTIDLPNGVNLYGYKRTALNIVLDKSTETGWFEVLTTDKRLNQGILSVDKEYKTDARLTFDYQEDYDFFKAIYEQFDSINFKLLDVVKVLELNPKLKKINIHMDEYYLKNFNRKKLRACVIGLGSMDKRRIRCLKRIGLKNIIGVDIREDRRLESNDIETFESIEKAMIREPHVLFICVPPKNHWQYQRFAVDNNIPFFTEASVISDGLNDIIENIKGKKIVGVPSSTMRFHPAVKKIRELLKNNSIGKPLTFTYHSGSFLPSWHPWDDPKKYYAFDKEQGAAREIVPFELSWLTWIFGNVIEVKSFYDNKMDFGIDDIYQILLKFESGVIGHLLVDVVSRHDYRQFKLLGSEGIIYWDWDNKRVECLSKKNPVEKNDFWDIYPYDKNDSIFRIDGYNENITDELYLDETRYFIDSVLGYEKYEYSLEDDLKILNILKEIENDCKETPESELMDIPEKWRF